MEIWKDIKGYEGIYQVSNLGRVRNIKYKKERILSPSSDKDGYLRVVLSINASKKTFLLHRLVFDSFIGLQPNLNVDHINNITNDNRIENLQQISHRENCSKDKWRYEPSSRYIGVGWSKSKNKWCARIRVLGKIKHLGYYSDELDAHRAYVDEVSKIKFHVC